MSVQLSVTEPAQRILITGATGFIGSALAHLLRQHGNDVIGVHKHPLTHSDRGAENMVCVDSDSPASCDLLVAEYRPDVIVHLGGIVSGDQSPERIQPMLVAHVNATVNWLCAARSHGVRRVIVTGSMEEPREGEGPPQSPYALSKLACRSYVDYFRAQGLVDAVQVGVAMGYGPGQRDRTKLVPHVIEQIRAGKPPVISSAERLADWVYIDDITRALALMLFVDELPEGRIEIGTGRLTSVRDVVSGLVEIAGSDIQPDFGASAKRFNEARRAANPAVLSALGWQAEVSLSTGLKRTFDAADSSLAL